MASPVKLLLPRKPHQQPPPATQRRFSRSHPTEAGSDLKSALLTVSLTLLVSFVVLRQMDIFSSGEWPASNHVKYILSDEDREAFYTRMKDPTKGPLVVVFYSETCLACRRMRRHFLRCAEEVEGVPFYAAQVGHAKNYDLARAFHVKRIPAIIVLSPSEDTLARRVYEGKPNRTQLVDFVKKTITSHQTGK